MPSLKQKLVRKKSDTIPEEELNKLLKGLRKKPAISSKKIKLSEVKPSKKEKQAKKIAKKSRIKSEPIELLGELEAPPAPVLEEPALIKEPLPQPQAKKVGFLHKIGILRPKEKIKAEEPETKKEEPLEELDIDLQQPIIKPIIKQQEIEEPEAEEPEPSKKEKSELDELEEAIRKLDELAGERFGEPAKEEILKEKPKRHFSLFDRFRRKAAAQPVIQEPQKSKIDKAIEEPQELPKIGREFDDLIKDYSKSTKTKGRPKLKLKKEAKKSKIKPKAMELHGIEEPLPQEPQIKLDELEENLAEIKPTEELDLKDFDLDFKMPEFEEGKRAKAKVELPETLEPTAFDQNPKVLEEAKEEIKSAIDKIKQQEKPSLFRKLFSTKHKVERHEEQQIQLQTLPQADSMSVIQNHINGARQALMKFDLDSAKKSYMEAMKIYNNLNPQEKAIVYNEIRDLYFERKSAEELKV